MGEMSQLRMSPEAFRAHQNRVGRDQLRREDISPAQNENMPVNAAKKSKHGNKKVFDGGVKVADSKHEHKRLLELRLLEADGQISELKTQVPFVLAPSVMLDGRKKPALRYVADFVYVRDGAQVIEDAKSPHLRKDAVFRLKKHLMMSALGLDITEV